MTTWSNWDPKVLSITHHRKFDIRLECPLIGFAAKSCQKGEQVQVVHREFTSSEDGDLFIRRLEGFGSLVLSEIAKQHKVIVTESSVDNMIALTAKDASTRVYINFPMTIRVQVKKAIDAGEAIYRDDIADVHDLMFRGIDIPNDVGVVILFSVGWRKGLYFDLSPILRGGSIRTEDLNQLLGGYYAYLSFQERFKISEHEWESLLSGGWFPFTTLKNELIGKILAHNREGWNIDDLLPDVQRQVVSRLSNALQSWAKVKSFEPHMDFISKAVGHYVNGDHLSCICVLFPRIEGILRAVQIIQGRPKEASQKDLAETVLSPVANPKNRAFSALLPLRFSRYLIEYYFATFEPDRTHHPLSRNTVSHGVATKANFDLKGATLGFLILDQLSYYFVGK